VIEVTSDGDRDSLSGALRLLGGWPKQSKGADITPLRHLPRSTEEQDGQLGGQTGGFLSELEPTLAPVEWDCCNSRPNPSPHQVLSCFRYGRQRFDSDIERVRHRQHGRMV
jgi:hypothetical protein